MTNKDKTREKDEIGPKEAGHERQEEQGQQEKGRDTKPGGRNDDQSKQPGHH
jgi:hypothetical protein